MKYQTIPFFGLKGAVYYEGIEMVIFSHVKISSFRAKAHLIFHWRLYNKYGYYSKEFPVFVWLIFPGKYFQMGPL